VSRLRLEIRAGFAEIYISDLHRDLAVGDRKIRSMHVLLSLIEINFHVYADR